MSKKKRKLFIIIMNGMRVKFTLWFQLEIWISGKCFDSNRELLCLETKEMAHIERQRYLLLPLESNTCNSTQTAIGFFFKEDYFFPWLGAFFHRVKSSRMTEKVLSKRRRCLWYAASFKKWVEDNAALWSLVLFRNITVLNSLDFVMKTSGSIREGKEVSAISQHRLK